MVLLTPVLLLIILSKKKFRAGFWQKSGFYNASLKELLSSLKQKPVWFHAVSVGETLAVIDLVKEFKSRNHDVPIVFSTVTYTGQQIAVNRLGNIATIIYFPFDLGFIVKKVIDLINPAFVVVVETEIWPAFCFRLKKKNIPLLIVNGRLSPKSFNNYKSFKFFFKSVLDSFTCLLMQAQIDADRIMQIGAKKEKVRVVGNLKYDIKPKFTASDIENLKNELALFDNDKVIIAGSTHSGEEEAIINLYLKLKNDIDNLKLILVPRHPERYDEVISLMNSKTLSFGRRTLSNTFAEESVFLLDTMGELLSFYSVSDIAFVGGSLIEKGGHNPLEPAVYSVPVVVGPHTFNFLDITNYMVSSNAAVQVSSSDELYDVFKKFLLDKEYYNKYRNACQTVFEANKGATETTLKIMEELL
ncbi:MAG: 3-deoxy-D-manno-octulosonic acid transferase [Vampirovibrionia bacterium]